MGVFEVVVLLPVGVAAPRFEEAIYEPGVAGHDDVVLLTVATDVGVLGTVVIGEEDARVARLPQEDQGVSQRLEPGFDG